MKNAHEARLEILSRVAGLLEDLAVEPDEELDEREAQDLREAMRDAAEMILDELNLEVVEVNEGIITATMR